VEHWGWLIEVYWKKYSTHLSTLVRTVGNAFGRCPVKVGPEDFWKLLLQDCGDLARATAQLVSRFRTCLFGTYQCHQRKGFAK
jgi:hypothetical protein